ncbi:hypothetical protein HMI54_014136 [Coelomomyces lativittatus]|nr:hypothetical protein HMI56_002874 [Coelomomyces lativittatus]KAJ1502148.1 hypothetical protein HMI55_003036 [Coelomomyces lativittatus]KAJ1518633.1 hypothetical protein HMI54_014136 [Coelomomyces lativittatus]
MYTLPSLLLLTWIGGCSFYVTAQLECTLPVLQCCPANVPPCPRPPPFYTSTSTYHLVPDTTPSPSPPFPPLLPPPLLTRSQTLPDQWVTSTFTTTVYMTGTKTSSSTEGGGYAPTSESTSTTTTTETECSTTSSTPSSSPGTTPTSAYVTVTKTVSKGTPRTPRPPLSSATPTARFLMPKCSSTNLGQQSCSSSTSFKICNTNQQWTQPIQCPAGTVCTSYPGNTNYILCDFPMTQRGGDVKVKVLENVEGIPAAPILFRHHYERKKYEREERRRRKYGGGQLR